MKLFRRSAAKGWLYFAIILVIALVGGTLYYQSASATKTPSYSTVAAKIGNISQSITISGTIVPVTNLELSFGSTGLVKTVNVQPGQSVKAGQVMATLDTTSLQAQVSQAQATVVADQAKLNTDEAGPTPSSLQSAQAQVTNAQNALAAAKQNLADTEASNQISQTQAQVAVNQAMVTLANDQITLASNQQTFANDQKLVIPSSNSTLATVFQPSSASDFDLATTQNLLVADQNFIPIDQQSLAQAQATLSGNTVNSLNSTYQQWISQDNTAISAAQAAIAEANKVIGDLNALQNDQNSLTATNIKNSQAIDSANQAITTDQDNLTNAQNALADANQPATTSQIQSDQAALSAANHALATANQALNEAIITAPISGVVAQVNISVGHAPSAATSTSGDIVLESPNSFEVSGEISDTQISEVALNQQAFVTPSGQTKPLTAKVSQITPMATITQGVATFPVNVLITQSSPDLFSGASAQVEIIVKRVSNVLTIPTSAIHTLGSLNFVNVLQNGVSVRKLITVGATSGVLTEVTSGLNPGDQVILANRRAKLPSTTTNFKAGRAVGGLGGGKFARAGGLGG